MIYRRGIRHIILLTALLGLLSHNVFAQNRVHVVVRGDTIFSISRSFRVSQEALMRQNGITDPSRLQVGMRLVIPAGANVPPSPTPAAVTAAYTEYTVLPNDTLYSIARARGVTLQALRDINRFSKDYVLKAGEKIRIPTVPVAPIIIPPQREPVRPPLRVADSSIRWPVSGREILYMNSNLGVLVSGEESESIRSLTGGTVVHAGPWRGYGNVVVVDTGGGYEYLYGVCGTLSVRKGDSIEPRAELGKLGIYPASGKPELVLIVSQHGSPIDPAKAPRF